MRITSAMYRCTNCGERTESRQWVVFCRCGAQMKAAENAWTK